MFITRDKTILGRTLLHRRTSVFFRRTIYIRFFHLCRRPPCPCACDPYNIATYVTNKTVEARKTWDLTPYQGPGIATSGLICGRWRIHERSAGLNYGNGIILPNGTLLGLPDSFTTTFSYNGYMALQVGCYDRENGQWIWPSDDYEPYNGD